MIKALTFTFIFISGVILLSNCEDENANPRSYPRVNTLPVTNISEKGVIFSADLYSLGTEKIIEHGFVWGLTGEPTITNNNRIYLGPCENTGTFQADVTTSLIKDIKYNVKSFIQTADHVVYGIPVVFKSLGSEAPIIYDFEPKIASWMDTILIKGKNFSWIKEENQVKLNNTLCTTLSSSDSTLEFLVNGNLPDLKSIVSVDLAGNAVYFKKDSLKLIPPVIQDFYPNQARWGDTIFVKGRYLKYIGSNYGNYLKFGTFNSAIIKIVNDSILAIRVPNELATISNSVSGLINGIHLSCSKTFTLLAPEITSIYPKKGLGHSILTLYGKFNPLQTRNIIELNNIAVTITFNSKDSIKVAIPYSTTSGTITQFTYKSAPFVNNFNDLFTIEHPVITSISPLTAYFGDEVTIWGKNLKSHEVSSIVYLGSLSGPVKSTSENAIVFTVPPLLDSVPRRIQIYIAPEYVVSAQSFVLAPPEITSVSPATFAEGDEITINGKGFCPDISLNKILIGTSPATILSATTKEIRARVPSSLTRGFLNMYILTGKYKRSFPLNFEFKSKWSSLLFPKNFAVPYGYESYYRPVSFSVDGKGYFLDNQFKRLFSFDPSTKIFTDLGIQTAIQGKDASEWVVANNTFYFTGGSGIFRFNSSDRSWTQIVSTAGKYYGTIFSIDGKMYHGLTRSESGGYWVYDKNISVYDPVNNSWSAKTTFPFSSLIVDRSFTLNNKAYLLFNDGRLYEYNPVTNMWSEKSKFPLNMRIGGVNFSYGNGVCFGLGKDSNNGTINYNDFYFYDPVADAWSKAKYLTNDGRSKDIIIPGEGRFNTVNFMIDNKEYIGFGINYQTRLSDFYEFDPTYSLK